MGRLGFMAGVSASYRYITQASSSQWDEPWILLIFLSYLQLAKMRTGPKKESKQEQERVAVAAVGPGNVQFISVGQVSLRRGWPVLLPLVRRCSCCS